MTEQKKRRVGILGGTFDPIHYGHIRMAETFYEAASPECILVMPSGIPAYKLEKQKISAAVHRENMVRLAIEDIPWAVYSDMEILREGNTYSSDTLRILHEQEPDSEFHFLVGADQLLYMDKWHEIGTVLSLAVIGAFMRPGNSREEMLLQIGRLKKLYPYADIRLYEMKEVDVSSTMIRRLAGEEKSLSGLLPEKTAEYILENGLYRN